MLHEDMIKEALELISQVDPEQKQYHYMIDAMSRAVIKQHPLVAMSAALAVLTGIIDSQNDEQMKFMYHYSMGAIGKAALSSGAYDEMIAIMEKTVLDEAGIKPS